jgi:hypothetical protein
MKLLYTQKEFESAKTSEKLPLQCYGCNNIFYLQKKRIYDCLNPKEKRQGKYCSSKCQRIFESKTSRHSVICSNCNKTFEKTNAEIKKTKKHFCSRSCNATYQNTHKTFGNRRSKLEIYLEEQLTILYPNLTIDYNQKGAINSELDIYIPSLKLAIELNGIFHYEPIYGQNKLNQIQNNDQRKFYACIEKNISLCIIDVSSLSYFKPNKANKFLNIIVDIINSKN